jgi:hypothetical protein
MGLGSHAIALGIGYVLGHPAGRERARKVPQQVRQLAARPEAARLAEKGKSLAGQAAQTAKQRLGRSDASDANGAASPSSGDSGRGAGAARRRLFVRPRRRPGGIDTPTGAEPGLIVAESSGDPATDARSAAVTDPAVAERTEAAMHGTLPPAGKPRS